MSDGTGTAGEGWSIRRMLAWMTEDFSARGLPSARLDAEVLLAHALQVPRVRLYLQMERPLEMQEKEAVRRLVQRRRAQEPVAYILGKREFYSRDFMVDARVLIPRPDTETLVDQALAACPPGGGPVDVLDLCTGSGCIGLTLAAERLDRGSPTQVLLTDISEDALAIARDNAQALGVSERVSFAQGDLFGAVQGGATFDVITANPPYVTAAEFAELEAGVRDHEPRQALVAEDEGPDDGQDEGLTYYRRIAAAVPPFLRPEGTLLVEVGLGQADAVADMLRQHLPAVTVHRDLGGIARVVSARRQAPPKGEVEPHIEPVQPMAEGAAPSPSNVRSSLPWAPTGAPGAGDDSPTGAPGAGDDSPTGAPGAGEDSTE